MEELNIEEFDKLAMEIIRSTNIKQKHYIKQFKDLLFNNKAQGNALLQILIECLKTNNCFDLSTKIRVLKIIERIIATKQIEKQLIFDACKVSLNMINNEIRMDQLMSLNKYEKKFLNLELKIINQVEENFLEELIQQSKDNNKNFLNLVYLLQSKKNVYETLKSIIQKKLLEEQTKFCNLFNQYLSQQFFNDEMYPLIAKSLRRSENNVDILNQLFEQQIKIDLSKQAEELIFQILKDYFFSSKIKQMIIFIVKEIINRVNDEKVIEKILSMFMSLIDKTIDENSKIVMFQMFSGINFSIKKVPAIQSQLSVFYLSNISVITQDENIDIYSNILNEFIQQSNNLVLNEKQLTSLKKLLTSTNKGTLLVISNFLISYLKKYGKEENSQCLKSLIPTANTNLVINQLKQNQKLVTNYQILLAGLNLCSLSQNLNLEYLIDKTLNYSQMFNSLLSDIYVNQQKFFQKVVASDLVHFISALIRFSNKMNSIVKPGDKTYLILANTLIQCFFNSQCKLSEMLTIIDDNVDKNYILQLIVYGLFIKVSFFEFNDCKEAEKFRILIEYLIKNFQFVNFEEINLFELIHIIYHPSANLKIKASQKFYRKLKQLNLIEKMQEKIKDQQQNLYYYFVSPTQSIGEINFTIRHHIFKVFVDFDLLEIFDNYTEFITESNFIEEEFLEQFDKDLEGRAQYCFDIFYPIEQYLMQFWFITKKQFNFDQIVEKQQKSQTQKQAQGKGKKGDKPMQKGKDKKKDQEKQIIMDEQEIAQMKLNQLQDKMAYYFSIVIKYYELLVTSKNINYQEYFFKNYYQLLMELAENKLVKGLILNTIISYFRQNNLTRDFAFCLTEQFLRKNECIDNESYPIAEKTEKQLIEFLNKLLKQWNENEKEFIIDIYYQLGQFIIENQDFCLSLKEQSMQLLFNIIKYDQNGKFKEEIFDLIIKHINRICYFQKSQSFIDFLINKLDLNNNKYLHSLFNDILNISEPGQQVILQSLNKLPQMQKNAENKLKFSFEIYIKLKILHENSEQTQQILKLSESLLNNQGEISFSQAEIENFNLSQFFQNTSKEEIELFSKLCAALFKNDQQQCQLMMQNVINLCNEIVADEYTEDSAVFFPDYFLQNIQQIDKQFFKPIYQLIIEKCCNNEDNQILIKLCMQLGTQIIKIYGEKYGKELTDTIDYYLENENEGINKSVAVVLIGFCAPFISDKSKLSTIQKKIIGLFETGSETLQKNLSLCIIDLMTFFENQEEIIRINMLALETNKVQIQRGAAYLIGGLIKGLGVIYLEKYGILAQIEQLMIKKEKDKNSKSISIGILYLMIALMENLGKIFEPYIQSVIVHLMNFFGDSNEEIRNLSLRATQSAMHNLSAYGVQLLLPILLKGFQFIFICVLLGINEQLNWRAKLANIEALGNMAYCSPKQLSTCLPQIVPKLTTTLTDTHPKVRESASQALSVIGSTIKNPEISEIVQILITALSDPFYQNQRGLDILLKTQFVHYVDIPALSLIIPILDYGLRSRDSMLKEKSSRIVGTILHLIKDPRDLMPYLSTLTSALIIALTDPLTEVRNIAAKACGCLSQKIGILSEGLIEQLEQILQNDKASSNEKAGAAQGLCEAVWGIGEEYFEQKFPEFLERTQSKSWSERDAYIGLFVFFPVLMDDKFEKYIKEMLEYVADSISEENEMTRNKVIRILKICIMKFGLTNTQLLLTPIREGLLNHQWRKRNGAIIIFGDLVETVKKKQKEIEFQEGEELGAKRDRILKTYIPDFEELLITIHTLKYDFFDQSKIQAVNVWKSNVENTPKIIKRQLALLIAKLIQMSVDSEDIKLIASTCIEDFCTKYFETMIQQIFQILLAKAEEYRNDPSLLNGTYLIMAQFLGHAKKEHLRKNQEIIQQILETNIENKEATLRQSIYACLKQYLTLLQWPKYQQPVLERIIEPLNQQIENIDIDSEEYTDLILCFNDLVATKSEPIFNYLTPFLLKAPISIAKIDILANNSEFIGPEIYGSENLEMTMLFLFNQLFEAKDKGLSESLLYCINQLSINLAKEYAQNFITDGIELLKDFKETQEPLQKSLLILQAFNYFFSYSTFDYQQLITELLEQFVGFLFIENQECSIQLNQIMKNLLNIQERDLSDQALHELIDLLQFELEDAPIQTQQIYAFNQPDGIEPYIQLIIKGMAYGMQSTINDAIELCQILFKYAKKEYIQEFIVKLTGIFIRVSNYKLHLNQKIKLLEILYDLQAEKSFANAVTLFSPQLQTTYFRILADFPDNYQYQALVIKNFLHLLKFVLRKDYLLNETWNKFFKAATPFAKLAYAKLLYANLKFNFNIFSQAIIDNIFQQITEQPDLLFKYNEAEAKEEQEEYEYKKDEIQTKLVIMVTKVVGKASNALQIGTLHKFIYKSLDALKEEFKDDSETANSQLLTCLNILAIYNYHNKQQVFQGRQIMKQILQIFFEQVLSPENFECILKFLLKNVKKNNDFAKFLSSEFTEFFKGLIEEWVDEEQIHATFAEVIKLLEDNKKQ